QKEHQLESQNAFNILNKNLMRLLDCKQATRIAESLTNQHVILLWQTLKSQNISDEIQYFLHKLFLSRTKTFNDTEIISILVFYFEKGYVLKRYFDDQDFKLFMNEFSKNINLCFAFCSSLLTENLKIALH